MILAFRRWSNSAGDNHNWELGRIVLDCRNHIDDFGVLVPGNDNFCVILFDFNNRLFFEFVDCATDGLIADIHVVYTLASLTLRFLDDLARLKKTEFNLKNSLFYSELGLTLTICPVWDIQVQSLRSTHVA